ncbi:hypothetical protein BJP40_24825 [Streptomyces sp. CC53]|uniref:hypothetical protein n=1 Tax=unclassified Streptomyces TaxID=2593676 RepID=UPI0008DD2EBB|nr:MULTISPECIES: hypothetical protein [unclassified Streptomyces]OII63232.1 hypothetical protein BJP40_24825 [Streptomyces sp. CC53]OII67718.1 hypothetical protein BJP39_24010 [Streptomyces sp. CC77]
MAIIDELRTPLYFAAGTADLAVQQARRIATEAPARIEQVRATDPKAVQQKVTAQAKEAQTVVQTKFAELVGGLDTDLKKLGETAQGIALRGVGVAAEYAVRARETYEKVAERGEQAVKTWRGDAAEEITEIAVAVEPDPEPKAESKPAAKTGPAAAGQTGAKADAEATAPEAAAPKKAPARRSTAKKSAPATDA